MKGEGVPKYLVTEDGRPLITEDGRRIILEEYFKPILENAENVNISNNSISFILRDPHLSEFKKLGIDYMTDGLEKIFIKLTDEFGPAIQQFFTDMSSNDLPSG